MATMHDYCLTDYDKIGIYFFINIEMKLKIFIYNQFLKLDYKKSKTTCSFRFMARITNSRIFLWKCLMLLTYHASS